MAVACVCLNTTTPRNFCAPVKLPIVTEDCQKRKPTLYQTPTTSPDRRVRVFVFRNQPYQGLEQGSPEWPPGVLRRRLQNPPVSISEALRKPPSSPFSPFSSFPPQHQVCVKLHTSICHLHSCHVFCVQAPSRAHNYISDGRVLRPSTQGRLPRVNLASVPSRRRSGPACSLHYTQGRPC